MFTVQDRTVAQQSLWRHQSSWMWRHVPEDSKHSNYSCNFLFSQTVLVSDITYLDTCFYKNRPNSYFLRQFWSHFYVVYVLQNVRRFFVICGFLFFKFFSFLKCLMHMFIVILLHFIESFLLLKTSSKMFRQLAIIIRFTKAFCRHLQHIVMIFAMFHVLKILSFAIFSVNHSTVLDISELLMLPWTSRIISHFRVSSNLFQTPY